MNLKSKMALATLSLIASSAAFAQAAAPAPDYTLAYNIGAVSDYRFRGIAQSAAQPSVQGGIDFTHKSGLYLGVWAASNVRWIKDFNQSTTGDYEVDFLGGYKSEIKPGLSYDIGAATYRYPGNNSGDAGTPGAGLFSRADTTEIYAALTFGIVTAKYSQSVGDFLGNLNSNASRYWEVAANFDLGSGYTLTPRAGIQTIPNQSSATATGTAANYTDYGVTLAKDFGNGLTVSAAATATDAAENFYTDSTGRFLGKSSFALGVKYSF